MSRSAQPFFVVLGPMMPSYSFSPLALTMSCQSPSGSCATDSRSFDFFPAGKSTVRVRMQGTSCLIGCVRTTTARPRCSFKSPSPASPTAAVVKPGATSARMRGELGRVGDVARHEFADAGKLPRGRVAGGLVERDEGEQVGDLAGLEGLFKVFGHQRQFARFHLFDLAAGDDFLLASLHFQDDALVALFGDEPGDDAALRRDDRAGLIRRADDQARVEDIGQQLLERAAAVHGDVGADFLSLAVNLVALPAHLLEDLLPLVRIAGVFADQRPHFGDHGVAFRIAFFADASPLATGRL